MHDPGDARISLGSPAVQAGLGVFDTLAVREGRVLDWEAHRERLERAAVRLDVALPDGGVLAEAAAEVAAEVVGGCGWVKIVAARGGPCAVFGGAMDPAEEGRAASAVILPWRRSPSDPLAAIKSLSYAAFAVGLEEARRRGADEGLWLNTRGHLAEGCTSSVFVVWRRKLFTPAIRDGILPGVTRGLVLRAARDMNLIVHEGKVRIERLERAQEAFLGSSVRGIRPLVRFEGRAVGTGEPGPLTLALSRAVGELRRPLRPAVGDRRGPQP